jgi:hypothetical protein
VPGKWAKIEVKASVPGPVGWIDYGMTTPGPAGDQVFSAKPLVAGVQTLPFFVPITAKANSASFARFRFTRSTVALSYDGYAPTGEVEDYLVKIGENCGIKWVQLPDTTPNGIDISVDQQWTLADDFLCSSVDKITDVHLWGSWLRTRRASQEDSPEHHSDDPVGPGGRSANSGPSPTSCCGRWISSGRFTEKLYAKLPEGESGGIRLMDGPDSRRRSWIWQVDIKIDRKGLPAGRKSGKTDRLLAGCPRKPEGRFGWKTRVADHFNDDAVSQSAELPHFWRELRYPRSIRIQSNQTASTWPSRSRPANSAAARRTSLRRAGGYPGLCDLRIAVAAMAP